MDYGEYMQSQEQTQRHVEHYWDEYDNARNARLAEEKKQRKESMKLAIIDYYKGDVAKIAEFYETHCDEMSSL